ncbi:MAG: efflux RND transporter periplasmic adaptor subunit [Candidatus Acidiferrum sp.]
MPGIHKMTNKRRTCPLILMAGAALLAMSFGAAGCGQKASAGGPGSGGPMAMPVQVEVAQSVRIADTTEYLSVLKSRQSAVINPQVEGQITKIFVKSGDEVNAGTPLLQIDPLKQKATLSGQEAARAAQEATLQLARINLGRSEKLYAAGVTSKQDLDNAQSTYDSAAAQLKSLSDQVEQQKVELHYYDVSAPVDGIVDDIPVHVGDRVTVSTLLTTVDLPGALEAYIYVPADRSKDLRLGLPVRLLDENGNSLSDTHITFVSPQVETDTQTVLAKAAVANAKAKLRIAQQVRAQVTWGSHDGPVVPVLAVMRINGQAFVFVASHEGNSVVARQKLIKLGDTIGNDYAVLDGLKPGDHIIVSGTQFLQDGMPVIEQIQKDEKQGDGKSAAAR